MQHKDKCVYRASKYKVVILTGNVHNERPSILHWNGADKSRGGIIQNEPNK
jgi:hypothetical protein